MTSENSRRRVASTAPVPSSRLILPGDVLVKAEKCAEEMGHVFRLPLSTSHHSHRWNASLKVSLPL